MRVSLLFQRLRPEQLADRERGLEALRAQGDVEKVKVARLQEEVSQRRAREGAGRGREGGEKKNKEMTHAVALAGTYTYACAPCYTKLLWPEGALRLVGAKK